VLDAPADIKPTARGRPLFNPQEDNMGLLDSVLGAALGGGQGGAGGGNAALLNMVVGMLAGGQGGGQAGGAGGLGGLGGLLEKFQQSGLGDVAGSWVSTGENQPIAPDQLGQVLGGDTISSMASQLGMNQGDLLGQLSQMLPQVVDKLTPNGQVPAQPDLGGLGDLGSLLGGLLKR
jgi:uncharacterized protein YidB (DUF937 family)